MDPTGLLDAVLAVAVYPGGVFLAVAALVHRAAAGRRPAGGRPGAEFAAAGAGAVVAATMATALLPLTASPALRLPPSSGTAGNLAAVGVLLALAVELGAASVRTTALAAAAAIPVLGLASAAGTLSVDVVAAVPGWAGVIARVVAACLLIVAGGSVGAGRAASVVGAALALAGAALVIPAVLASTPPALGALVCLAVVALSGALSRRCARWSSAILAGAAAAAVGGATVLALLSGRA